MTLFLTVLHVIVCVFLIAVVLLQRGRGADIGAVFGAGAGGTVFGARGAGNFLTKATTASAVIFMLTSLTLAYFGRSGENRLEFESVQTEGTAAPVAPDANAPLQIPPPPDGAAVAPSATPTAAANAAGSAESASAAAEPPAAAAPSPTPRAPAPADNAPAATP
jgi:preprotein translocase subunit SecG